MNVNNNNSHRIRIVFVLLILISFFSIIPAQKIYSQDISPSSTFSIPRTIETNDLVVVTGVLVLITLEPSTNTPAPTYTITLSPTSSPTITPTKTQTPTSTKEPTSTLLPIGPVETVVSSPFFIVVSLILISTLFVIYIVSISSKLTIIDLIKRLITGQKLSLDIEPTETIILDNTVISTTDEMTAQIILGEEFNLDVWLDRPEFSFLIKYINKIDSGNIALAGPRGIGKTTLMYALLKKELDAMYVTLQIATPTRYDEKEFVLNLYEGLCRSVIDRITIDSRLSKIKFPRSHYDEMRFYKRRQSNPVNLLIGIAGLIIGSTQLSTAATSIDNYLLRQEFGFASIFIALLIIILLFGSFFLVLISLSPNLKTSLLQRISEVSRELAYVYDQTQQRLERIRYEQTIESSGVAELSLSDIIKLGSSYGRSLTRQPYTLVSLVADYRDFIELITNQFSKVIIGIDELDKVQDAEQAREFLRKIKGVFSLKNTYYIVSVSEEALEAFELRSLFGKDEVDSTFTSVIRLFPLSLEESKNLLSLRNVKRQDIETLISVLSGGVPRDLIRLARKVYLNDEFAALDIQGMIKFIIVELYMEAKENIRLDKKIKAEEKLIINSLDILLDKFGPLKFGHAIQIKANTNKSVKYYSSDLLDLLLRLKIRIEIMGFLGIHTEVFEDKLTATEFQKALSIVTHSPYEADLAFNRLQSLHS